MTTKLLLYLFSNTVTYYKVIYNLKPLAEPNIVHHSQVGRRTKHLYDWMVYAAILAKGSSPSSASCSPCASTAQRQRLSSALTRHTLILNCQLVEIRCSHRRRIDEYPQCYRQSPKKRWVIPLIDYMEEQMWTNSEAGGDIRNGRWTPNLLSFLLEDAATPLLNKVTSKRHWYESKNWRNCCNAHKASSTESDALRSYQWKIMLVVTPSLPFGGDARLPAHKHYMRRGKSRILNLLPIDRQEYSRIQTSAPSTHRNTTKPSKREDHRTNKLKFRKLRNILLLCR